ncbi:ABC transporter ATP-binding protein [Shewanella intestini]|uniref:ABC transporter ATP-binding protein n=1 Tax=Shewanella intestini TaxID=2017544 RepID=A0ABS5I647_9GAMM|nr:MULTISPECIES: ABC transporter ATP-binding protein [Shewanella]MBR9729396.1 ABC transporter ATP-binding protein [Shewanella intestini]MRG37476.1 ATP-binding cassette domain-containing protein [Shewanella sp. XMDDZSB0408]
MSTLSIENVSSAYDGTVILKQLNLALNQGEIVALLGPSGCGKTTLLRAIAGLQPVTEGRISINGNLLNGDGVFVPSEQRDVGMIFQDYALFPHMTVAQNVLFGVRGLSKLERESRLDEMLTLVKLEGLAKRYPHELSGGQQQRVSIARSLAYEPDILLLDEPFSNIDSQVRNEMMLEIRQILKQHNVSAVFVTHSKDEAFVFADKLALFHHGSIAQYGLAETLYHHPKNRYVAQFLGAGNYISVTQADEFTVDSVLGKINSTTPLTFNKVGQVVGELLLRPEQLQLTLQDDGNGTIVERHYVGTACQYWVEVGKQRVEVRSQQLHLNIGQNVQITAQVDPMVIF